ncbi:hypothetical protein ACQ5DV_005167, partial [Salmonella enterica subsp. enterica]
YLRSVGKGVTMNEPLIIFSREWAVTAALSAYLVPAYAHSTMPVYGLDKLMYTLREQPRAAVVLGLRPHEHVAELYRLRPLLTRRAVLFVERFFYWTDYNLPEWLGLKRYGFGSWDTMQDPFSRRIALRCFRQQRPVGRNDDNVAVTGADIFVLAIPEKKILERANRWLYRELSTAGLTGYEIRVLSLMVEGHNGNLPSRIRSLHKNNGLNKLGMTKRVMNLYRGVKVRPELQAGLPLMEQDVTETAVCSEGRLVGE